MVFEKNSNFNITPENEEIIIKRVDEILAGKGVLSGKGKTFVQTSKESGLPLPYLIAHCV